MSTLPAAEADSIARSELQSPKRESILTKPRVAALVALLAVAGLSALWPTVLYLWGLWTTDALKSIGMIIPVVSAVLIFRVWRTLGYETQGSWWGALILAATIFAVHLRERAVIELILTPQWTIFVPPHSLVAFAYTAGVVLLVGGIRLFRAALFPIGLMWFVNPIPHVFNVLVDLPLQRVSAHVARAFAIALGQPLSPDQMRLMFTPDFGMFIAPGCNGIRGAVTMGFIALIAGYVYRFRWRAHVAVVIGAVLLGYVFNFIRLCCLVLYYMVALRITWLQNRAEMGDYIIGAVLFLAATILLFTAITRLKETPGQTRLSLPPTQSEPGLRMGTIDSRVAPRLGPRLAPRVALMLLIAIFGAYSAERAAVRSRQLAASSASIDPHSLGQFPRQIGSFTLVRSWNENVLGGPLLFHWAEYAPIAGGDHVAMGISPVLGSHDTLICHSARGEDPVWHDQMNLTTAIGRDVSFSASLYNEGSSQFLEATTLCNGNTCGEYASDRIHFGFVYSMLDPQNVFSQDPERPIPILLRVDTLQTTLPADQAREQLASTLRSFAASIDLNALTRPYRRR